MIRTIALAAAVFAFLPVIAPHAAEVEVYLSDMLDNKQKGYCLDIARGKGARANPDHGLQGHTCYSPLGELLVDQIFDSEKFAEGVLYMPKFDVCAYVESTAAGASVGLAACDGTAKQSFVFSGKGTITPAAAPDMCLTVGEATRSGRSDANQIKVLSLEPCTEAKKAYQSWDMRSSVE